MDIRGIITPLLTPFTPQGKVDVAALEREVHYVIDVCQVDALEAAAVETQEYQFLSHEERRALIEVTAQLTGNRLPLIIGVSHPNPRTAAELAHLAEDVGAAAVQLLIPLRPFGGQPTTREVVAYFSQVGRETRLPIVAYHNPGPGAEASPETMLELAKLDCVAAFKESSRDLRRVGRLIEEIERADHARYFTTMEMLLISLLLGGAGATMPPPAAKIGADVVRAYRGGDLKAAVEGQRKFSLFPARWIHRGLAPVLKAAMRMVGVDLGDPHPPFEPLSREEFLALQRHLREIGLV